MVNLDADVSFGADYFEFRWGTFPVLTARMKGWETRTSPERTYQHHREMGTAKYRLLMARFKDGHKDYNLGVHPLWELWRVAYQMTKPPRLLWGRALFAGWFWCVLRRGRFGRKPSGPSAVARYGASTIDRTVSLVFRFVFVS